MKLTVINRSEKEVEECDYRNAIELTLETSNNKPTTLSFFDGEPEDSNLSRDFSDVYRIPNLIEMAYEAGFNRESLEVVTEECDEL